MLDTNLRRFCSVIRVDIVSESTEGSLTPYFDSIQDSPLMRSGSLRATLKAGTADCDGPYVYRDDFGVYFAALSAQQGYLYVGPMSHNTLSAGKQRQFYAQYGITTTDIRGLRQLPLPQMYNVIMLSASFFLHTIYQDRSVPYLSQYQEQDEHQSSTEKSAFLIHEEFENEANVYRHTYHEEQQLMQAIRTGDADAAVRIAETMDTDNGRLAQQPLQHWKNLAIVGIALCSRATIESSITPETAYRVSGYYIQKCDAQTDEAYVRRYRNNAIRELANLVHERLNKKHTSSYTERCKDYISKHYREKIYLEDIAAALEISPSYLSKLFHRETGIRIQDYITQVRVDRAAKLLIYSELPLSEIAEYVNFPSQSYFGQAFKKRKGVTPKRYRDQNQPKEFWEKGGQA